MLNSQGRLRFSWYALLGCGAAGLIWGLCRLALPPAQAPSARPPTAAPASSFQPTVPHAAPAPAPAPDGMAWIPGGEFSMGCDDPRGKPFGGNNAMPDARPVHRVAIDGFWIDRTEVTNRQFAAFVTATSYVTVAERAPKAEDFPGAPPENLVAGSIVFTPPAHRISLENHYQWWAYVPGADWRHPSGPLSSIDDALDHPVVQVAYDDAVAYAQWAGKRLPTEAEWECAARGGLTGAVYPWGNEFRPGGRWMANTWQGAFPAQNTSEDGYAGLSPVGTYPANAYGLHDVSGNVWEWCSDWYRPDTYAGGATAAQPVIDPQGPSSSHDPQEPGQAKRVMRGGSFLCTDQYCSRYIVGTRGKGEISSGCNHIGFRCVQSPTR